MATNKTKAKKDHRMNPDSDQPKIAEAPAAKARHWPLHLHRPLSWLVIGLVAVVLVLIAYAGHYKSKPPANYAGQSQQTALVSIKHSGFSPSTLTVRTGTPVSWVNRDSRAHQVAADPYPKNNSIPGFNSDVLLQPSDSYSFSFSRAGTYTYHDQLNPFKMRGTVVVK